MKLTMVKQDYALYPLDKYSRLQFDKIPYDKRVIATVEQPRSPLQNAKFHVLAEKVSRFGPHFKDADDAIRWVKRQIPALHHRYKEKDGTLVIELKSTAFASMDEGEFNAIYDEALDKWCALLGTDRDTLEDA